MSTNLTVNDTHPCGKDLVLLCMDFRYYQHLDETNTKWKLGEKMIWIGCPNCRESDGISDGIYKYSIDVPIKNGFTNPSNHFTRCVGSKVDMKNFVQERMAAKQEAAKPKKPLLERYMAEMVL